MKKNQQIEYYVLGGEKRYQTGTVKEKNRQRQKEGGKLKLQ